MTNIERARAAAAERYPEALTDSQGREHRCIPREAILSGQWDRGDAVRAFVVAKEGE